MRESAVGRMGAKAKVRFAANHLTLDIGRERERNRERERGRES